MMSRHLHIFFFGVFVIGGLSSMGQTFTSVVGQTVPDDGQNYFFDLSVSGLSNSITADFGLERVCVNYNHTWCEDVELWLIAPNGMQIELTTGNGGSGDNFTNTCFTDNAFYSITEGSPPFTGNYKPEQPLMGVNNGQNPNGTWKLKFYDTYWFADSGFLHNWSLTFTDEVINPEPNPIQFDESNLPLVFIDAYGQTIPDDPKINALIHVIDNGPGQMNQVNGAFTFEHHIGIETRGNSSQMFPKKGMGLEMWDITGADVDTTFLGMPSENDWILFASYSDKSLINNVLNMHIARSMGYYASRTRFCEVFINGDYRGVYVGMEKIKRNKNRVDIAKLTLNDNSGDQLTGGYIFKMDKNWDGGWQSQFNVPNGDPGLYQYVYPKVENITPQQAGYLQAFFDSVEVALHSSDFHHPSGVHYDELLDVVSFADYFIINEFSKNIDGFRLSSYFNKDKNSKGGKLKAGPAWDFDLSFGNADYCDGQSTTGWYHQSWCASAMPNIWNRLLLDPEFTNVLKCRWNHWREELITTENLNSWTDSVANYLAAAQQRNFTRWPILGTYVWPNPSPIPANYAGEILELKNFMAGRINWLDANMPGVGDCPIPNESANAENFGNSTFPAECWQLWDADADGHNWEWHPMGAAVSMTQSSGGQPLLADNYLVLPPLNPAANQHLEFKTRLDNPNLAIQKIGVWISASPTPTNFTTEIYVAQITDNSQWESHFVDLSAYQGTNVWIAFRHYESMGNNGVLIDDVVFPQVGSSTQFCNWLSVANPGRPESSVWWSGGGMTVWAPAEIDYAELLDVRGAVVRSFGRQPRRTFIEINDVSSGIYFLRLGAGERKEVFKVLIP
jgi:subtilisin-like proprotein convertase family protein